MKEVVLVLPHQLFENQPLIDGQQLVIFVGTSTDFLPTFYFHKKKLVLHRASMRFYYDELQKKGITTHYLSFDQSCFSFIQEKKIDKSKKLLSFLIPCSKKS